MNSIDMGPASRDGSDETLVTICITAYRRPTMMIQALLSCVAQDYRPLEIDISDDSPNDYTEASVRAVPIPPGITLRYRRHSPSLGEPGNVASLFQQARGRYLVLLHDDDALAAGAVKAMMTAVKSNPGAVAVFGMQNMISSLGELDLVETRITNQRCKRELYQVGVITDPLLCSLEQRFPNNGYLVETAAAQAIGYRGMAEVGRAGDRDFAIRLGERYKDRTFVFIADAVSHYRLTEGSSRSNLGVCWKHYDVLAQMVGLTPIQAAARDKLMEFYMPYALVDNAVMGQRKRAFAIFFNKAYRHRTSFQRQAYHLLLILFPQIYRMRGSVTFATAMRAAA